MPKRRSFMKSCSFGTAGLIIGGMGFSRKNHTTIMDVRMANISYRLKRVMEFDGNRRNL